MICYLRASTIQYDVRLQKYVQACVDTKTPYIALTWDRMNNCSNVYPNEKQYKKLSPYGRKWGNLFNLILWQFHLLKYLLLYRSDYKVIHACNLDTIMPALLMKLFGKRIIFDIYDSVWIHMERFLSKKIVDVLILPNERRLKQVGVNESQVKNFLEIQNVPSLSFKKGTASLHSFSPQIHLSYVGVFEKDIRGLENLIEEVLENEDLTLDIAGVGSGLEQLMIEAANKTKRIKYYGSVDYSKALQIMGKSDFIVAMYYTINQLHKYASPNKYYESLYLGVPMITTKGTLVGELVEQNKVGYAIGEGLQNLHDFFLYVKTESFKVGYFQCITNANKIWNNNFSNYYMQFLCKSYIQLVRKQANI